MVEQFTYELDLPPGVVSDTTTFAAKGHWADSNNCRFWQGKPQALGFASSFDYNLGSNLTAMHAWRWTSGGIYVAYGVSDKLWIGPIINNPVDRSPVGIGTVESWSLDNFGTTLLACKQGGKLYEKTDPTVASAASEVTEAPDEITYMLVTTTRQVMALGTNEEVGGAFNPMCIRFSTIEDYSSAGSWTTSTTNNAGEVILEGRGRIVAGCRIGEYLAVWTTSGLYLGTFVGDPAQVWRFDRIAENCGLVGPHAVIVTASRAYWVAPDLRIWTWTPGELPQPVPCPIHADYRDNATASLKSRICVGTVSKFSEVWFCYADGRDSNGVTNNTRYIAVSLLDGAWFRGQLERTAILDNGLVQEGISAHNGALLMADGTGDIVAHELNSGGSLTGYIQSSDEYLESGRRRVQIQSIRPDFEAQATDVSLTVFVRSTPQASATTKGPYTLLSGAGKKDFRASGMIFALKFSWTTVPVQLGKTTLDCVTMGGR